MPLHDVGYQPWQGRKSRSGFRWWTVAATGTRLAFRSTWLSRSLLLSWVPAIVAGFWFFFYEQSIVNPDYRELMQAIVASAAGGQSGELALEVMNDPAGARHKVWASILLVFFRYPQPVLMVVVVGIVAPRLISSDLRNRGYLLYFSRPLSLPGYMFGKALVIWAFLALITTLPALILYVVGLSLSPDLNVIWSTWDLPLRIVTASLVLMLPVSAVALACSATTVETRYAAFCWFAIWVVGWVSYSVLRAGETAGRLDRERGPHAASLDESSLQQAFEPSHWELLSPFHVLGRVQQFVFGLFPEEQSIVPYLAVLATAILFSIGLVRHRLLSRLRA